MKVLAIKFREVVILPGRSHDVTGSVSNDDRGKKYEMIYDRPAHMIAIIDRESKACKCVPLANVVYFEIDDAHVAKLRESMQPQQKAPEQPQRK
jgi:hypothetical protein